MGLTGRRASPSVRFLALLPALLAFDSAPAGAAVSRDADGWTVAAPSADARTIYVSASDPASDDANNGQSTSAPVKTLSRGMALLRTGFPDRLLLKAGDVWDGTFGNWTKSGRSAAEPLVVASYGAGPRPQIRPHGGTAIRFSGSPAHVYVMDLDFTESDRAQADPYGNPSQPPVEGGPGIEATGVNAADILVEGCAFRWFVMAVVVQQNGGSTPSDVRVRRCLFADSYRWVSGGLGSHGIYAFRVLDLLVEDCVFDHVGWLVPAPSGQGDNTNVNGWGNYYSHGVYINECVRPVLRGNAFLRVSSAGAKFNTNAGGTLTDGVLEDNLFVEGEVGILIGGNVAGPDRFINPRIKDNVLMHIDRNNSTRRGLGWGIDAQGWGGGTITGNVFLLSVDATNTFGVKLSDVDHDVSVMNNIFWRINANALSFQPESGWSGNAVSGNVVQNPDAGPLLVNFGSTSFASTSFSGNTYWNSAANLAKVGGVNGTYAAWVTKSGETGSRNVRLVFPDPDRDVEAYDVSLGGPGTFDHFIQQARLQSRADWRPAYTAHAVNEYVRAGFNLAPSDSLSPARPRGLSLR